MVTNQFDTENAALKSDDARAINRIASIGGSVFDYFIDKFGGGVKVNLYGNNELLALLYEQAQLKGIQIGKCFSDKDLFFNINLLDKHLKVGDTDIVGPKNFRTQKVYDDGLPTIITDKTEHKFKNEFKLYDLINYSSLMQRLFRTVFEYKKQCAPKLKIVVVQFPKLEFIQNKNSYELSLAQNKRTINPFIESKYDEQFEKDVSWLFPEYYKGDIPVLVDHCSQHLNIVDGHRVTVDLPKNPTHTIFHYGPSVVFGYLTDDENTVVSSVQKALNRYYDNNSPYQCLNCSFAGGQNFIAMRRSFLASKPQNGDIVIFYHWLDANLIKDVYTDQFYYFDPQKTRHLFDRPHHYGEYLFADRVHLMPSGNDLVGNAVALDLIENGVLNEVTSISEFVSKTADYKNNETYDKSIPSKLKEYLDSIVYCKPTVGAIVMNCNPFTLGHRYLVEYAASKCDRLYIFAVEEDLSFFPFADRIELIKQGVSDLKNVTVLPSGNFIISRTTFPAYFEKEASTDDTVIDASSDIEIFAKHIAPQLNITVRFAGEEPLDNVTRQYNSQMKRILPQYGIKFDVIPRKEINGQVVSASRVRKLLKEKDFEGIKSLVPPTTYEYLKINFDK